MAKKYVNKDEGDGGNHVLRNPIMQSKELSKQSGNHQCLNNELLFGLHLCMYLLLLLLFLGRNNNAVMNRKNVNSNVTHKADFNVSGMRPIYPSINYKRINQTLTSRLYRN